MHGVLDTSIGWVSNGVTGSQAFAAYDMGMDVWLGNSRANPPRRHAGPGPLLPLMHSGGVQVGVKECSQRSCRQSPA